MTVFWAWTAFDCPPFGQLVALSMLVGVLAELL